MGREERRASMLPPLLVWYVLLALLVIMAVDGVRRWLNLHHLLRTPTVLLELTPPSRTVKAPHATEQLFTVLRALTLSSSWKSRLLDRKNVVSLELVSTREQGIRYLIRVPEQDAATFQQQVAAYLPDVHFEVIADYISVERTREHATGINEYRQLRHYAYPLASHEALSQHDPVAYVSGTMTKLEQGELLAFQIVLTSAAPRAVAHIESSLTMGRDPHLNSKQYILPLRVVFFALRMIVGLLGAILGAIGAVTRSSYELPKRSYASSPPTGGHIPINTAIQEKLTQPLFQASVRALVVSNDASTARQRLVGMSAALSSFTMHGYQGLINKLSFPARLLAPYRLFMFLHRLPSPLLRHDCVLSASEVAALYHFPYDNTTDTENLVRARSRTLPAAASLKHAADTGRYDAVFGVNNHHGHTTPIGLTSEERARHVYIVGGTGNGKTTMLQYAIVQDMQAGKGVAVIDPHGDMAQELLRHVPEDRVRDVIYLNPVDIAHPIGLNLLEVPEGLEGDELLMGKERVTEAVVSVLRKVFSDDEANAHRIEALLRNTVQTALTIEDATLFTVLKLLRNTQYRKSVVSKLEDEDLRDFWREEFGKAGGMQQVSMTKGVTARLDRFKSSLPVSRMLGQAHSTISFGTILDSSKILICNFSHGELGEDTSTLFGTTVLAKLKLAAERRARQAESARIPFYVYVDEFQNFATTPFVKLLSTSRKYKLYLTLAEQSTAQQEDQQMMHIILDNVGTVICFRVRAASEQMLLPLFKPFLEATEMAQLPSFHFYMRISALQAHEPVSGETVLLTAVAHDSTAEQVIGASQAHYGGGSVSDKNQLESKKASPIPSEHKAKPLAA